MATRPGVRSIAARRPRVTSSLESSIGANNPDTATNDAINSPAQLAEQMHAWLTQELGYQPNATLINTSQTTSDEDETLQPENLEVICRGALPPMLQHLRERLFARSHVAKIQQAIQCAYEKHQLPLDRFSTEHIRLAEKRKEYNEALDEATRRTELQQQRCEEMIANINAKEKAVQALEEKIRQTQHRIHVKRGFRYQAQLNIDELKNCVVALNKMTRVTCNRDATQKDDDSNMVEIQKKLLVIINQMKPVFQHHLSLNTAIDEEAQKRILIQIKELYDTTDPVILLKAIALMLKLSGQSVKDRITHIDFTADAQTMRKTMEEQGYKTLWATIEDRLQAHIQLFVNIKRLKNDSKELADCIAHGETNLRQAIATHISDEKHANIVSDTIINTTRIAGLEKAIKMLQTKYLDQSNSNTYKLIDEARQSIDNKSLTLFDEELAQRRLWIKQLQKSTAALRDRISQQSLQTWSICQQTAIPLAPLLARHEQQLFGCLSKECSLFNNTNIIRGQIIQVTTNDQQDITSKLRSSLLNHRVQADPAIIEFYNAIHFRPYQTLRLMPDYLGNLGATAIKQHAIEIEQQQIMLYLQQSTQSHVNQILELPLLANKQEEIAVINRKTRYPTVKLLAETIHSKDYNQLEHIQHRLSTALDNTQQSEMLCDVINEVYTARELFYSGKLADNWLRIQGYRFAELVHDQSNVE